jgi:hypothetical protein
LYQLEIVRAARHKPRPGLNQKLEGGPFEIRKTHALSVPAVFPVPGANVPRIYSMAGRNLGAGYANPSGTRCAQNESLNKLLIAKGL